MELSPLRLTALTTILILSWLGEILAGDLANVTATPNNVKAGENSIYTINFTTSATGGGGTSGIPVDGKIVIDFSSGFTVSGVLLASAVSGIDGGFSITRDNTQKMVTLTRDGTGSAVGPSTAVSIRIANVGNETNDGSYNLTVETQTNAGITIDGPTWSSNFTITPADLSYFTLTGVPASVVAGANFPGVVTVTAYDLYGNQKTNYTGTVSWSSTDTDGDVQLPGNYTFVPADNGSHAFSGSAFRLVTAGGQTVTVADGTVSKESSVITVTVAALASFTLNNPGTQTAGTGFSLTVTGAQDQWGNAWSGTVTVSFTDGGGHVAPNGSSPSLSNITVSNGSGSAKQVLVKAETGVQLRASSGGIIRDTNGFKVEAGNLSYFTLSGVPASVTAGNNFPGIVTVTAYDLYGNQKTNYTGTVSWSSTDTDGDVQLPPNYTFVGGDNGSHGFSGSAFRLVTAGGQTVTVADGPVSKESSVITVNVAALSNFTLNNPGTRTAGTGFSLTVTGAQDQWGNAWSGTVTVSFTDGGSHVAPNGSSPSLSNITVSNGSGSANQVLVKAETGVQLRGCAGGITKDTNPFTVTAGALSYVKIVAGSSGNGPEYTTNTLAVGGTFVVHAAGYDAYGNYRSDENVTWAVTGGIGTVAPGSGTATTFTATTVGEGTIIADHATALDDATGAITVTGGSIAHIILRDAPTGGGNIVNDKSMTADDQLTLYAAGYDGGNNYLGDVSVTWSSTGTLAPAVSGTGSSLTFSPTTAPASGKIRASYSPTIKDSTGVISVSVGGLKAVKVVKGNSGNTVALNDTTLAVGDSLVVHAAGYDADGNYRTDESVSWSLTGNNIGTIATGPSIKATFHATQVGVGYIKADHSNPAVTDDLAGPITVGVGDTSYVLIRTAPGGSGQVVGARTLTADDSLILYAAAYDNANNYLGAARVIWAVTNSGWNSRISKTDTSIVFSPVMAPDSGKIIANHYSAKDDTTGMIVVKPGKPFGNITLIPTPTTIPADGLSKSTITSNVIRDAENNPVAENTQFTARTTLGTLVTPNASGTSVPVFANASGKITFELQASSVGGIAHIYVTSVGGSATGDTSVAISNLKIVSVYTEKTTVSRGQTGVPVSMTVENLGTVTIDIDDADLTFTGSANRDAEYTVHKPSSFPSIPGNQSRSWSFSVDVNPAASTEVITIDGTVSGKVNGVTVSDNSAETKDSWLVQTPAQLKIIRVETTVDTVYQGQRNVPVSMIVKNEGQATALLTSNTLTFWSIKSGMDVTANYEVSSLPGNPSSIAGSGQATLQLRVHVATGATVDSIRIDGQVGGKDANSEVTISDVGAETIDYWFVRKKPLIAIDSFEPSSPEVTKGQEKDWYLTMTVINRGSTPAILDPNKTKLTFRIGGQDVTSQYTIIRPSVFLKSKTDTLRAPTPPDTAYTDTLRFIIDKTGGATGPCNIQGTLYVTDAHTGEPFENHAYTGITVQEPANLTIVQITPSQSEVTRGQEKDWYVKVPLKNSGASSVTIDTSLTDLGFSTGNDFVVLQPYFIISGNLLLASNATDTLIFTVTTTGQAVGPCTVTAHIFAIEDNSGDTLAVSKNTQIVIEEPAALRIQSVVNRARNAPHVNTNQNFAIQVRVAMVGGLYTDEADSVKVLLTANSTSIGSIILPWVSWESPRDTVFQVTAPDTVDSALVFTAHILRAKARNTGALIPDTLLLPAVDDTALAIVEWPAKLSIVQLIAPDTVQARQINPWSIGLIVKNEGSAGLTLKQPTPQDIILKIGDTVQPDYFIIAPDSLNGGGLTLKARQEDTLVYIVKATGEQGGLATIEAHLTAIDENSGSLVDDSIIEDIFVETSAAIRIESTLPICHNYEEEVGLVNVGRDFRVRVWVTNAGREQVDKVMVVLNTEDEAHVTFPDTIIIDFIAPQSKGLAEFPVLAKALDNRVEFVASVVSAKGHNSGLQVPIQTPIDATAVVRIQTPANLELRAQTTNFDSVFTRDQTFEVLAQVLNKGEAQVDHSGKLALFLPPGYYFDDPIDSASTSDTVNFRVGEWVNWTIHTPAQASGPDTIRLALIQIPKDKNIDSAAVVSVDSAWLVVWTDSTQLTVTASIIEPTGATDGIVSTEQDFKVRANVKFSSNLENPQLRLVLPSGGGYQIVGGDSTQKVTGGPVFWTVKAPRSNSPKAYLKLQATAIEKGSQHLKTAEHSLSIETVERANLNLTAWVSDPPVSAGATTVSLSFNQKFKISARVINSGKAGVSAPTQLRIDPGATGVTIQDDILRTIEVGTLVTWTLQAPNFVTSLAPITISMDSIPADENTNEKAFKTVTTVTIQVATVETGTVSVDSVWIASPLGAIDGLLSTDQEFRIKARVSWVRCQNIRAEIQLPDGSGFYNVGDDSRYFVNTTSSGEGTVDWIVRAPVDALSRQEISITAHGYDAYNTTLEVHSSPATVTVSVVQKAKCALQAVIFWPPSAVERIVSVGQTFQIKAYLTNSGTAGIKNNYSAELTAPHGYTLSSNSIQSVSPADTIKWTLRAPEQPAEVRQIKIRVVEKPRDVNSDTSAYFTEDTREISIETKENSLIIATLPSTTPAAIAHGDRGIPMLRLLFRNSGGVPNNILLRKLAVKLKNRKGELLPSPSQAISRIAAVKSSNPEVIYGEVTALTDQNPIEIVFSPERPIRPALPDSINIIVDVAPSASVSNFQVVIDSSSCIDAIEEYSGKPIALKDADGNPSSVLNLVSEISEVMKAELSASFCNYPNPFGRPDRAVTNIIYYLKQDSDVEIKIYSLTGELVWSQTYSASEPHGRAGMHDWDQLGRPPIVWDGKNEWHTTVLNGVYLAILKTNHGETAITKIAVLK